MDSMQEVCNVIVCVCVWGGGGGGGMNFEVSHLNMVLDSQIQFTSLDVQD